MAYLYGIWGCFLVFAAAGLSRLFVVRRMREELSALGSVSASKADRSDDANRSDGNLMNLLKEHRAKLPVSRTRSLSNVLTGVVVVATVTGTALIIAAQFQPHSLFHLISAAR